MRSASISTACRSTSRPAGRSTSRRCRSATSSVSRSIAARRPIAFGESALGGIVSITTRTPGTSSATARAGMGSFGTTFGDLTAGGPRRSRAPLPRRPRLLGGRRLSLQQRHGDAAQPQRRRLRTAPEQRRPPGRRRASPGAHAVGPPHPVAGRPRLCPRPGAVGPGELADAVRPVRHDARPRDASATNRATISARAGACRAELFASEQRDQLRDANNELGLGAALRHETTRSAGAAAHGSRPVRRLGARHDRPRGAPRDLRARGRSRDDSGGHPGPPPGRRRGRRDRSPLAPAGSRRDPVGPGGGDERRREPTGHRGRAGRRRARHRAGAARVAAGARTSDRLARDPEGQPRKVRAGPLVPRALRQRDRAAPGQCRPASRAGHQRRPRPLDRSPRGPGRASRAAPRCSARWSTISSSGSRRAGAWRGPSNMASARIWGVEEELRLFAGPPGAPHRAGHLSRRGGSLRQRRPARKAASPSTRASMPTRGRSWSGSPCRAGFELGAYADGDLRGETLGRSRPPESIRSPAPRGRGRQRRSTEERPPSDGERREPHGHAPRGLHGLVAARAGRYSSPSPTLLSGARTTPGANRLFDPRYGP